LIFWAKFLLHASVSAYSYLFSAAWSVCRLSSVPFEHSASSVRSIKMQVHWVHRLVGRTHRQNDQFLLAANPPVKCWHLANTYEELSRLPEQFRLLVYYFGPCWRFIVQRVAQHLVQVHKWRLDRSSAIRRWRVGLGAISGLVN